MASMVAEMSPPASVLSSILARNERLGKTSRMLGRMCLVGKSQKQRQLLAWHQSAIGKLQTEANPEEVTGLLLLYPSHFLHVVEVNSRLAMACSRPLLRRPHLARAIGPTLSRVRARSAPAHPQGELSQLTEFVQMLVPLSTEESMVEDIRMLASTDDVPSRLFPGWLSSSVGQHSSGPPPPDGGLHIPMPTRIADTYTSMLKLGRALTHAKKQERESMLSDLRTRHAESLPTQETVTEVSHADDTLTVSEFVDIFCKPIDIKLDREIVWPIETELTY
jgi:hypothetical protein